MKVDFFLRKFVLFVKYVIFFCIKIFKKNIIILTPD
jgi:hypothetical protein